MAENNIRATIEALLFVVDEPITRDKLYSLFPDTDGVKIEEAIDQLKIDFAQESSGLMLREVGGGIQICTKPQYDEIIREYIKVKKKAQLSRQALEALAIIAYEQPITTPEIREIRGTDPTGVIKTLLQRKMIRFSGRKEVIGRPFLYCTTKEFLFHFGLKSLDDLPKPDEFGSLIPDPFETEGNTGGLVVIEDVACEASSEENETER